MDIHNATEFRNFVNVSGLGALNPQIAAVSSCVADYERGCSCWKAGDRQRIYDNCKALYIRAIHLVVNQYAVQFAERAFDKKLTFSQDGVIVGTVSR